MRAVEARGSRASRAYRLGGVDGYPLRVLAQPVAEGIAIENDSLARVLQVSLAPELIHVVRDDLPRGAHILGQQFVGERRHAAIESTCIMASVPVVANRTTSAMLTKRRKRSAAVTLSSLSTPAINPSLMWPTNARSISGQR